LTFEVSLFRRHDDNKNARIDNGMRTGVPIAAGFRSGGEPETRQRQETQFALAVLGTVRIFEPRPNVYGA